MNRNIFLILIVGIFSFFGAFVFLVNDHVLAKSNLVAEVNSTQSKITLDWNDVSKSYKLYLLNDEGEELYLWSGTDTNYVHKDLEINTPYKYKIYAYNDNEEIYNIIVNTRTLKSEKEIDNMKRTIQSTDSTEVYFPMSKNVVNTTYNNDTIALSWEGMDRLH